VDSFNCAAGRTRTRCERAPPRGKAAPGEVEDLLWCWVRHRGGGAEKRRVSPAGGAMQERSVSLSAGDGRER